MEKQLNHQFSTLSDNIRSYADTRLQIIKLTVADKVSAGASGVVSGVLMAVFGLFFLLFAGCAAGFYIGREMDSYATGFLIVAGFFFLLLILILLFKKAMIQTPITNMVIKGMLHDKDE